MPSFGNYETISELHRTGFVIIYRARPATEDKDNFAIKAFQPIALLAEEEQAKSESKLFLSSAHTQHSVQTRGGLHWAPIHQYDSTAEGAFYVTDLYDHSLQKLIDGHVKLSPAILHKIIESIALGLVEVKQACNRPHGNLKATNVLLGAEGKTAALKIVLSDPLPDEHIKKYHWTDDLRAVGELIYQLIMHRSAPTTHGWKVSKTDEWKTLGKYAKHWINLCNRLLSTPAKPDEITIEGLIEELARLKKIRSTYLRRWIIAAGLLVATGIAVFLVYGYITRKPPDIVDWNKVCVEYLAWVGALESKVKKSNLQEKDPHFKTLLKNIEIAAYPREVAYKEGSDVETEKDHPEHAGTGKTKDALEAINDIKRYLNPLSADNPEGWPLLGKIDELVRKLEDYDSSELSGSLQDLIGSVQPPDNRPDVEDDDINENSKIADNINIILASKDVLQNICASVDKLDEDKTTIEAAGEPIIRCGASIKSEFSSKLGEIIKNTDMQYNEEDDILHIDAQKLNILSQQSQELKNKVNELAVYISAPGEDKFHRELFISEFKTLKLTEKAPLEKWLQVVKNYQRITDPRLESVWGKTRAGLDKDIKLLKADPDFAKEGAKFRETLGTFDDSFDEFPQTIENNNLFLIARDSLKIKEILDDMLSKLHDFQQEVSIEVAKLVPPKEWLARQQQLQFTESDILQQTWSSIRNNILSENVRSKLQQDDKNQLREIKPLVEDLWSRLQKIDHKRKQLDQKFDELPTPQNRNIDLKSDLITAYKLAREKLFRQVINQFPPGKVPDLAKNQTDDPDAFTPQWHDKLNTFSGHGDDLVGLTESFYELNKSFALCYLLDDETVAKGSNEFVNLHDELKKQSDLAGIFVATSPIQSKYKNLINRIGKLEEIIASNDRVYLSQTAGNIDSQTEAIYTAWKRLGEIGAPPWPRPDEGDAEERIRDILRNRFQSISDAGRSGELTNELSSVGKERQKILGLAIAANLTTQLKDDLSEVKNQTMPCETFNAFTKYVQTNMQQYNADLSALEPEVLTQETLKSQLGNLKELLENLAGSANLLAVFLRSTEWNNDSSCRKDLFIEALDGSSPEDSWATSEWTSAIQRWIDDFANYKILDSDPRDGIKAADITNLNRKIEAEKDPEKRNTLKENLALLAKDLDNSRLTYPAIELHQKIIVNDFTQFADRFIKIKNELKPDYCKYVEFWEGQIHFASEYESLLKNFEPVLAPDFEPAKAADFKPLTTDEQWLNLKTKGNSLIDKFFHVTGYDAEDAGLWPLYVRAAKDNSVIFRFIPNRDEPFYIAIREITNAQYTQFLRQIGATSTSAVYIIFKNTNRLTLVSCKLGNPPCAIKWDKPTATYKIDDVQQQNTPVVWVTSDGAKAYAHWMGTQLPTVRQHRHAIEADTGNIYPWGNDLSKISVYTHLPGRAWADAAAKYNNEKSKTPTRTFQPAPQPLGAVRPNGFKYGDVLSAEEDQYFSEASPEHIWPYDTISTNTKPNMWGLYDMIGNVWEWCISDDATKPVICGFSCLTPKSYILDETKYMLDENDTSMNYEHDFKKANNDIGFRIIFLPEKFILEK
jgi:formylglycine-generating enzyme required for sulfatase activity